MGKITEKLPNKDEFFSISKLKRRHRRKDLDDLHSKILKTKRKSVYAGMFRNGTKGKNIKKGKYENMVSKARLAGDALKLFDGETESIYVLRNTMEDESTDQLPNKDSVKNNLEETLYIREKSPVLGKKQSKNLKELLEDTSTQNKETEIVFEPIDIPEVVITYNPETEKMMKVNERIEEKREITHSEHSKNTFRNSEKHNLFSKLCRKMCDELKSVLINVEDPLSATRRRLKEIYGPLGTKRTLHETARKLSSSKSPKLFVSKHQAYIHSNDSRSSIVQFPKNHNSISCSLENSQYNKKNFTNFSIDRITSTDFNPRRDERYLDASILQNSNSKLPLKKRFFVTSHKKISAQFDDKEIITIYDSDEPNDISQICPKEIDRSEPNNERKFCEADFVNMFQNLPTPSTVNRRFFRPKVPEFRMESTKIDMNTRRLEEPSTDLYINSSNRENKVVRFHNTARLQDPFEMLTEAATFIENQHPSQSVTGNLFMDTYVPTYSNSYNLSNYQSSPFYSLYDVGLSNFNVEPTKLKHRTKKVSRREDEHICLNRSKCSHECNISQTHQNHAEAIRTTVATRSLCVPKHDNDNLRNNVSHLGVVPLNFTQPVKYYALDNGVNVHKMPVYINDDVCECRDHKNYPTIASYNKRECSSVCVNLARCHEVRNNDASKLV